MANPNIVSVATIAGGSVGGHLTTSEVAYLTVTAEYIIKVNSILIANIHASVGANCDIRIVKANATPLGITNYDISGTFYIAKAVEVPNFDVLVALENPIYLMETDALQASASTASVLDMYISYDVIID